ncbi:MAG: BFD-like [2Fe-2S] binding domain [Candidatus Sumerlaeota bacterium]|nr:BFD-like [2Fe-2S] binding domain [Candidatus Sumerlaeota bacterium]
MPILDSNDDTLERIPTEYQGPNPEAVEQLIREPKGLLCLCEGVPACVVIQTIRDEKPTHVSQVSRSCGAGIGCGSCHALIEALIARLNPPAGEAPSSRDS